MNGIYDPNDNFDFEKLILTTPTIMSGGNHFIKYFINDMPLYIQPPKCKVRQGIVKTGKRAYCDLMFTNENENFIRWLENLENYSQKKIFNNREKWFETSLDQHDIENSFTSPLKVYKSGKYYIVRTNIPTVLGKSNFKIYDENENIVEIENIKDNENVVTILEIQGIKCSARSFQIEIEMKQLLVLKPVDLFEKCILTKKNEVASTSLEKIEDTNKIANNEIVFIEASENHDNNSTEDIPVEYNETPVDFETNGIAKEFEIDNNNNIETSQHSNLEKNELIEEVNINLEIIEEQPSMVLKKRNDVYYQMYRESLRKAKLAKEMALANYLEAKRIKNTYMLDELNEDSDFEEEEDSINNITSTENS
jgi:hypothetical protein